VAQASLQRPYADQIQTARQVYDFCINRTSKIVFDFTTNEQHKKHDKIMKRRFKDAEWLKGTQKVHYLGPISIGVVRVKEYGLSKDSKDHVLLR
jgi:hypothetical protein